MRLTSIPKAHICKLAAVDGGYLGAFPKAGVPILGVPIIRTVVFLGLYWGPPILRNYHLAPLGTPPNRVIPRVMMGLYRGHIGVI